MSFFLKKIIGFIFYPANTVIVVAATGNYSHYKTSPFIAAYSPVASNPFQWVMGSFINYKYYLL